MIKAPGANRFAFFGGFSPGVFREDVIRHARQGRGNKNLRGQRLDELVAQEAATREQIAELNDMAADTRRLHSAAEATNIVSNNRKAALDAREAELDTRAQALELTEATRSHKALQRREAAVQARGEAVAREEKRLATVKTDLEGKHASIKGLADTLHH